MRPPLGVLLLAGLLVTSGCLGFLGDSRPESDRRALDALDRSRTALANVTSYRARSRGTLKATADDQQETITVRTEATVNVSAREVNVTAHLPDPTAGDVRQGYVTGYTAYTECRLAGWGRRNLSESRQWFEYTPIGRYLAVLTRVPVYWRGTEQLNGTETAVIVAHPTEEELQAAPIPMALRTANPDTANVQNATLTVWIGTETNRPVRARREIRLRKNGATATLTLTWQFDEYNAPAAITRPSFDESEVRERGC